MPLPPPTSEYKNGMQHKSESEAEGSALANTVTVDSDPSHIVGLYDLFLYGPLGDLCHVKM